MKYTGDMDKDLKVLIPEIVADRIASDPIESAVLVEKAKRVYAANKSWGKTITDTNKGRDTLYMFMNHWHDAYLSYKRMGRGSI